MTRQIQQQQGDGLRQNVGSTERIISSLAGTAIATYGLRERTTLGILSAAAGGVLLFRGVTGHCPFFAQLGIDRSHPGRHTAPVHVEQSITINRTPNEVYTFWRDLENLPRFMHHLKQVRIEEETNHSRWEARLPGDLGTLRWTAEVTADEPGEKISWRSLPGSEIYTSGTVRFRTAPAQQGTEIHVEIDYRPPAGAIGRQVAAFFNRPVTQLLKEDIRRLKALMEAGEIPTTEGQPSGKNAARTAE